MAIWNKMFHECALINTSNTTQHKWNSQCFDDAIYFPGYPAERGPICYSCDDQLEGTSCNRIEHCEPHEVMSIVLSNFFSLPIVLAFWKS